MGTVFYAYNPDPLPALAQLPGILRGTSALTLAEKVNCLYALESYGLGVALPDVAALPKLTHAQLADRLEAWPPGDPARAGAVPWAQVLRVVVPLLAQLVEQLLAGGAA